MKDYFNILGVAESASPEEIKKAYKKLAMQHHPDRGGEQSKFQEIQEAYATLSDPEKRAQWVHGNQQHHHHHGGHPGFQFNFGQGMDFGDILRGFQNGDPFGQFRQPAKNRDLRVMMEVSLESTLENQAQHINVQQGNGTRTVTVDVPRGVMTGMQMRCPGHGDHSNTDLPPGDLYVEFRVRQHPNFQTAGTDLLQTATINCVDAILGTKHTVVGLDGKNFEIVIPSGTQQGTKFRIQGQGLWVINQTVRGDLYIEIAITVPQTISATQLQQLQQLVK